jgi:hypothetical protein
MMDNLVDLMASIDESSMNPEIKEYLKRAVVLYAEGKGAAAFEELLDAFMGDIK